MAVTQSQKWVREYSDRLFSSFQSSAGVTHHVSKGDMREYQIYDTLTKLLPTSCELAKRAIVMGPDSKQSKSFDGAFIERRDWPILYIESGPPVVMVESVRLLTEVKSTLNKREIEDISRKIRSVRDLKRGEPPVAAFAYESDNVALNYVDTLIAFAKESAVPEVTCVLNKCVIARVPEHSPVPMFFDSGKDSLLLFLYQLITLMHDRMTANVYRRYSQDFFDSVPRIEPHSNLVEALADPVEAKQIRHELAGNAPKDLRALFAKHS